MRPSILVCQEEVTKDVWEMKLGRAETRNIVEAPAVHRADAIVR